jgi:hypothetical protein
MHRVFSNSGISPYIAASIPDKKGLVYRHFPGQTAQRQLVLVALYLGDIFLQIFYIQLSTLESLSIASLNF